MKTKQQLYIKNDKGRYEPYKPEEPETDNKLYRKINGKYVPCKMEIESNSLSEGVWVVTRYRSCTGIGSGEYLREQFRLEKCSDLDKVPLSKIGSLEKCAQYVTSELRLMNTSCMCNHEFVRAIIGKVFEYYTGKDKEK